MIPTCCYDRISYFLLSMVGIGRGGAPDDLFFFNSLSYLIHSCLLLYLLACLSLLIDDMTADMVRVYLRENTVPLGRLVSLHVHWRKGAK